MSELVLAFHGSRDPRAGITARAVAHAVAAARPDLSVYVAFLDLETPRLDEVLGWLSRRPVTVVPMLLTPAYHARVDIPAIVTAARGRGSRIDVTPVLGAPADDGTELLVAALRRHLTSAAEAADRLGIFIDANTDSGVRPGSGFVPDAIVLAAAGSRDPRALAAVDAVAAALGDATGLPCRAGYASGIGPSVADVVADLRRGGATNIALASHFLAPGVLHDRAMLPAATAIPMTAIRARASTLAAGHALAVDILPRNAPGTAGAPARRVVATSPLGVAPEITELVLRRIDSAESHH